MDSIKNRMKEVFMYTEQELVAIAKRENNTRRNYLVVNRLQGKHIPVSPGKMSAMFGELAELLRADYQGERLLLVGFAETATAIGAAVAAALGCSYIQTTREVLEGQEYLYFSEVHSHAAQQKLVKSDMDEIMGNLDRIVFMEDEVTTGNTILNIIDVLDREYGQKVRYSVASLLNGMNRESEERYSQRNIETHYLVKTDHSSYIKAADRYEGNGNYLIPDPKGFHGTHKFLAITGAVNARRMTSGHEYEAACKALWESLRRQVDIKEKSRILVLGTEEFMYPAMITALELEKSGCEVRFHATTRSPVVVSEEEEYPLRKRYELKSLYDENRTTYIYNLEKYDMVFIITDAALKEKTGFQSLFSALEMEGNEKIYLVQWLEEKAAKEPVMRSSYIQEDVILLLKDITGMVKPKPTKEREKLIQSGTHYCEMLPIEYSPSEKYMEAYKQALKDYGGLTAQAVGSLADKIMEQKGNSVVLVSLARAGIPVGILLKRYIRWKYGVTVPHYSISIIRGRGIDKNAVSCILNRHRAQDLLFVDGWIGKGAILGELSKAVEDFPGLSSELAVLADPANVTRLCGTHEDILIPSSCLNSTVSGLVSRTFLRDDIIQKDEFHGAVYYEELKDQDLSYEFINSIESCFQKDNPVFREELTGTGMEEVRKIAEEFSIQDINLIKPGIGEATRVLLRRFPWKVLIGEAYREDSALTHLIRLAAEKEIPVEYYPLNHYKACGIIKNIADI